MKGMQLQLFDDLPLPPRPSHFCDDVTYAVIDKIMNPVLVWMYQGRYSPPESEREEVKEDLFTAIQWDDDAYKIAKSLEHAGWDSDGELLDILDSVSRYRYDTHKELVYYSWILKHGVTPRFSLGDKVSFNLKGKFEIGEIIRVHADTAKYTIHCPQHGHVKSGVGTHGHIIHFEECSPVEVVK